MIPDKGFIPDFSIISYLKKDKFCLFLSLTLNLLIIIMLMLPIYSKVNLATTMLVAFSMSFMLIIVMFSMIKDLKHKNDEMLKVEQDLSERVRKQKESIDKAILALERGKA